jgi:hypothetical protein
VIKAVLLQVVAPKYSGNNWGIEIAERGGEVCHLISGWKSFSS